MSTQTSSLRYCIQCRDKASGTVADFIYDESAPFVAVSPLFYDLQTLFRYMHARGLQSASLAVSEITLPARTRLVLPDETVNAGDLILWSRNPQDAWTAISKGSPFTAQTPEQIGCCIVRFA